MPDDSSKRNCLRRVLGRHEYSCPETESLYRSYVYPAERSGLGSLVLLMIAASASLSIVNLIFVSRPTLENISGGALCLIFLVVVVFINTRYMSARHLAAVSFVVVLLCLCFAAVSFPIGHRRGMTSSSGDVGGVWRLAYVIFGVYVFVPLRIYVPLVVGFLLPLAHSLTSIFGANGNEYPMLLWRQIIANLIIFVAVNFVGIFCYDRKEKARRRVFDAMRTSVSEQLRIQDNGDKMERLLLCIVPPHVAADLKTDLRKPHLRDILPKTYIQRHDCVSIIFAKIIGLSSLTTQCSNHEFVRLTNELFGRFDQLGLENHCLRIQIAGDCYYGVCGVPDPRPDHAKCCAEMGLHVIDAISFVRESTDINLRVRVGVHTGHALSGVIGQRRWIFDVWSEDVEIARITQETGLTGRVHVTQATVDHLQGEFPTEPGSGQHSSSSQPKTKATKTYFIVSDHCRKTYGPLSKPGHNSQRLSIKDMDDLTAAISFNAEIPFSNVVQNNTKLQKVRYTDDQENGQLPSSMFGEHTFAARVQKNLNQIVGNKSLERNKLQMINCVTLCFKSSSKERQFQRQEVRSFPSTVLCSLVLLVLSVAVQAVILPRTLLLLVLFVIGFTWISFLLILILGYRIKCIRCDIRYRPLLVWLSSLVVILLIFAMTFTNVLCCRRGLLFPYLGTVSGHEMAMAFNSDFLLECDIPQYIYLSAILTLLSVTLFVRLTALVKLVIWIVIGTAYVVIIEYPNRPLFSAFDDLISPEVPSDVVGVLMLIHYFLILYISSRDLEWTQRMRFLWDHQVCQQQLELHDVQEANRQLMLNILPDHVAPVLQELGGRSITDLYSQRHSQVAVVFLTIVNLTDIYRLLDAPYQVECLRFLNDIITAIDKLLDEDKHKTICKIKSNGTNYLAAVGLHNGNKAEETEDWRCRLYLTSQIEFIFDAAATVAQKDPSLTLRAGLCIGSVVAGVVGAKKPQYEIWGETVNIARKLEKSCLPNCIQVTENIYELLKVKYHFHCRGQIRIPGRPELTTYFLPDRRGDKGRCGAPGVERNHPGNLESVSFVGNSVARQPESSSFDFGNNNGSSGTGHARGVGEDTLQNHPVPHGCVLLQRDGHGYFQAGKVSMTPPSSLGRRRVTLDDGSGGGGEGTKRLNGRPPLGSALHRADEDRSPDLPMYHYRNGMYNGAAIPEKNTLTQSQILRNSLNSRTTSEGGHQQGGVQRQVSDCSIKSQRASLVMVGSSPANCQQQQQVGSARNSIVDPPAANSRRESLVDDLRCQGEHSLTSSSPSKASVSSQTSNVPRTSSLLNNQPLMAMMMMARDQQPAAMNGSSDICPDARRLSRVELDDIDMIMKEFITDIEKKPPMTFEANNRLVSGPDVKNQENRCQQRPPMVVNNICHRSASFGGTRQPLPPQKLRVNLPYEPAFSSGNLLLQPAVEASVAARVKNAPRLSLAQHMFSRPMLGNQETSQFPAECHAVKNGPMYAAKVPNDASRSDRRFAVLVPPVPGLPSHGRGIPVERFPPPKNLVNNLQTTSRPLSLYSVGRHGNASQVPQPLRSAAPSAKRPHHHYARNSDNHYHFLSPGSSNPARSVFAYSSPVFRHAKSLEDLSLDEDGGHHRPSSPLRTRGRAPTRGQGQGQGQGQGHAIQDDVSLSSYSGSEMSRSDPTLSYDSSSAIESEYDNYRPGMASDEDYFVLEPISDVDLDLFDDIDIENVMVSDSYGSSFIPMLQKIITDV